MIKITIGLVYDSVEVMASEEQTVKDVYAMAGKGGLLTSGKQVKLARTGAVPRTVAFTDTLASLGVVEGDELLVSENNKSA